MKISGCIGGLDVEKPDAERYTPGLTSHLRNVPSQKDRTDIGQSRRIGKNQNWFPGLGSNQHKLIQSQLSYH